MKNPFAVFAPLALVTLTLTVPAVPVGVVAVICESLSTVNPAASTPPTWTAVAPVNPVPAMTICVPPAVGPLEGVTVLTVGSVLNTPPVIEATFALNSPVAEVYVMPVSVSVYRVPPIVALIVRDPLEKSGASASMLQEPAVQIRQTGSSLICLMRRRSSAQLPALCRIVQAAC